MTEDTGHILKMEKMNERIWKGVFLQETPVLPTKDLYTFPIDGTNPYVNLQLLMDLGLPTNPSASYYH